MPSRSLRQWQTTARTALDEIAAAHAAIGGTQRGRRYATQQINQAYAMMLSSQFQGFSRNLHSEAVDLLCAQPLLPPRDQRLDILRVRLTEGRKLDSGNPNPGNIGSDFNRLGIEFWRMLKRNPANEARCKSLERLNDWRNAIAHQDFNPDRLGGRSTLLLQDVRQWRATCEELATEFDAVIANHLAIILGAMPW